MPGALPTDPDVKISLIRFLGRLSFPINKPVRRHPDWRITVATPDIRYYALYAASAVETSLAERL